MKTRIEGTKEISHRTIEILKKYIAKVSNMNDYLELEEIMINMIEDLRCNSIFTLIDGEKMLVVNIVKDLIEYEDEFKKYKLDYDRLTWIVREFHDSYFDYDKFEEGVKKAMRYTAENYEK